MANLCRNLLKNALANPEFAPEYMNIYERHVQAQREADARFLRLLDGLESGVWDMGVMESEVIEEPAEKIA